jgi:hypothetical protein
MGRKKPATDPRDVFDRGVVVANQEIFERWYRRLKTALTRMVAAKRRIETAKRRMKKREDDRAVSFTAIDGEKNGRTVIL